MKGQFYAKYIFKKVDEGGVGYLVPAGSSCSSSVLKMRELVKVVSSRPKNEKVCITLKNPRIFHSVLS